MPKNIALFIDGTWNEPDGDDALTNTNVYRLYLATAQHASQRTFYRTGIGTGRWFGMRRLVRNAFDGAFGRGMSDRIKDAYRFLSNEYERGDRIYLFGFSRGAFAARSLAGFAEAVGIQFRNDSDDNHLEEAYAEYENGTDSEHSQLQGYLRRLDFRSTKPDREEGTDLPIYFLGVWDTVAALGLQGRMHVLSAPFTEYHKTELPSNVTHARHALALHELRGNFAPLLWNRTSPANPNQSLRQVWFPGAHSDVGGGYEEHRYWSAIAFDWMASEASVHGLELHADVINPSLPADASVNNSLTGLFAKVYPEVRSSLREGDKMYLEARKTFQVHDSAMRRLLLDRGVAYRAVENLVSKAYEEVDDLTIRLGVECAFRGSTIEEARLKNIDVWWHGQQHASQVARARNDVESFMRQATPPSAADVEALALALSRLVICGGRDELRQLQHVTIRESTDRWNRPAPRSADLAALENWIVRLEAFGEAIQRVVPILPDEFAPELDNWAGAIRGERDSLRSKLVQARLRIRRTNVKPLGDNR